MPNLALARRAAPVGGTYSIDEAIPPKKTRNKPDQVDSAQDGADTTSHELVGYTGSVKHLALKTTDVKAAVEIAIKKVNTDERIVYGEVYAPYVIDTHSEMMFPEDVRLLAHRFLERKLNDQFDVMHNNELVQCWAVESFVARDGDPDFTPGAWVLGTKISEADETGLWDDIKVGKIGGYSVEMMVRKVPAIAEILVYPHVYGYTEKNDGHDHAFFVTVGDDGRVTGGYTSEEVGNDGSLHSHRITLGTATDEDGGHAHRFFLP